MFDGQDILDIEHIESQIANGALGLSSCLPLVDSIIGVIVSIHDRMRCHERKRRTEEKWLLLKQQPVSHHDLCNMLEFVMDRVYDLRVDCANARLRAIAPVVRDHGVAYERRQFHKKLVTLDRTEEWIRALVSKLTTTNRTGDLIQTGMVDLVVQGPEEIPETLRLDLLRVKALNAHFHTDVMRAIVVATVLQHAKVSNQDELIRTVKEHLPNPSLTISKVLDLVAQEEAEAQTLKSLLEKHLRREDPVYACMVKTFRSHWIEMLSLSARAPGVMVHGSSLCNKLPKELVEDTEKHAMELSLVCMLNLKVHKRTYEGLIMRAFLLLGT